MPVTYVRYWPRCAWVENIVFMLILVLCIRPTFLANVDRWGTFILGSMLEEKISGSGISCQSEGPHLHHTVECMGNFLALVPEVNPVECRGNLLALVPEVNLVCAFHTKSSGNSFRLLHKTVMSIHNCFHIFMLGLCLCQEGLLYMCLWQLQRSHSAASLIPLHGGPLPLPILFRSFYHPSLSIGESWKDVGCIQGAVFQFDVDSVEDIYDFIYYAWFLHLSFTNSLLFWTIARMLRLPPPLHWSCSHFYFVHCSPERFVSSWLQNRWQSYSIGFHNLSIGTIRSIPVVI